MKKIVTSLLLSVVVLLVCSCESKDPEGRLSGKTYRYKYDNRELLFWGYEETYKFYHSGQVSYELDGYMKESWGINHDYLDYKIDKQYLRYEVQGDDVYVYWDNDQKEQIAKGTIKGNTIHMQDNDEVKIFNKID